MTREDLITKIKAKMDIETSDTSNDYYSSFYDSMIDECLSIIANTVLPYQKKIEISYGGKINSSDEVSDATYYSIGSDMTYKGISLKAGDWLVYSKKHENWERIPKNNYGVKVELPDDILSFSNEALPMFVDNLGNVITNPEIFYVNGEAIALPRDGSYTIWYNALYPSIENQSGNLTWLPRNVALLIPPYVAGELLMNEDLTRSTILKNEFETMLSRLDDNKILPSYSIKNSSGWTY